MEHERFIARRRARFDGIDGKVNIPYGTALTCQDGFLMHLLQPESQYQIAVLG